jgi:Zn-dependent metalloprotease
VIDVAKRKTSGKARVSSRRPKAASRRDIARSASGLTTFSMHAIDPAAAPMMAKLRDEHTAHPAFAFRGLAASAQVDAETAATRYLEQAFKSPAVRSLTAPTSDGAESEFKSVGTETIPLTGTTTVKYRQSFHKIPVYGSLVTVELDDHNDLVSMNSALGEPRDVSPIARISPAAAVSAVDKYPGFRKDLDGVVPRLHYYFDKKTSAWRLVFILEDVAVMPTTVKRARVRAAKVENVRLAPRYMDYIVDAHSGKVVAELPRTPSLAAVNDSALDGLKKPRQFKVENSGTTRLLQDSAANVQTFDFKFGDPSVNRKKLPGPAIKNPPKWSPSAVSAHANAVAVSSFLRTVLLRNNIDNNGGPMNSSINCVVANESPDGRQWFNAFWNGSQMVYGQRQSGSELMSMSVALDVVGHEMFHGVTDFTARLEYAGQSGALNESYSDIFGIIIANFAQPDTRQWNWNIAENLSSSGKPFRNMANPALFGQPAHMKDFRVLPDTANGDWGGVHVNSGIHNKAAQLILTSVDASKNLVFKASEVAAMFYLAITQQLSRTSQFTDSRRAVVTSARTLFRALPPEQQKAKLDAIGKAFTAVGIKE